MLDSVPSTCDIILSISERGSSPRGITSVTRIVPSVIVPVLSRHTISALASISIEYISCTSVLFFASRTTLRVRVRVTRR